MATILRGRRTGRVVSIRQFANDWVAVSDDGGWSAVMSPTSFAYTPAERARIDGDRSKGYWPYEWKGDRLVRIRRAP